MLNDYRDQAKRFLDSIAPADQLKDVLPLFREELRLLDCAVQITDVVSTKHQIYDLLFLVMEMAAIADVDLDSEWRNGADRKSARYSIP